MVLSLLVLHVVMLLGGSEVWCLVGRRLKFVQINQRESERLKRDIAFVDRADIKAYVGPPTLQARYKILSSCLQELLRTRILTYPQDHNPLLLLEHASLQETLNTSEVQDPDVSLHLSKQLREAAEACEF